MNPLPKDLKIARWKDFREILGCLERYRKDYFTLCSHLCLVLLLTKSEQEIISLKFIGGFSHKEIAHITGTTVAAAKKRYERAIKKLRAEMEVS